MNIAIIIPVRYGSTRFPGKPLAKIGGRSMLSRVVDVAREAAKGLAHVNILVATEDQRIADHAKEIGAPCMITSDTCRTGSDRALEAARSLDPAPDVVINLQGDAPFTPPHVLKAIIESFAAPDIQVSTPVHRLSWAALDHLRTAKQTTPFSGTTAIIGENGQALWFSKTIIPAIRKENRSQPLSPVYQHIGLYGFRIDALERFCALPASPYEELEGLEQLRLLENGIPVHTVCVKIEGGLQSGIDSPEDLERAESFLKS